jgi:hypothetical protein
MLPRLHWAAQAGLASTDPRPYGSHKSIKQNRYRRKEAGALRPLSKLAKIAAFPCDELRQLWPYSNVFGSQQRAEVRSQGTLRGAV